MRDKSARIEYWKTVLVSASMLLACLWMFCFGGIHASAKTYHADTNKEYTFTGMLERFSFTVANGEKRTAYRLKLNKKVKIDGDFFEGASKERYLQVPVRNKSMERKVKKLKNKKVKIKGNLISGHTGWYAYNYSFLDVKSIKKTK